MCYNSIADTSHALFSVGILLAAAPVQAHGGFFKKRFMVALYAEGVDRNILPIYPYFSRPPNEKPLALRRGLFENDRKEARGPWIFIFASA